jgi:hypothetical protein
MIKNSRLYCDVCGCEPILTRYFKEKDLCTRCYRLLGGTDKPVKIVKEAVQTPQETALNDKKVVNTAQLINKEVGTKPIRRKK